MVPKVYFESFCTPHEITGDYFLRPDRIMAVFSLDPARAPEGLADAMDGMRGEKEEDQRTKTYLGREEKRTDENGKRCEKYQNKTLQDPKAGAGSNDPKAQRRQSWIQEQLNGLDTNNNRQIAFAAKLLDAKKLRTIENSDSSGASEEEESSSDDGSDVSSATTTTTTTKIVYLVLIKIGSRLRRMRFTIIFVYFITISCALPPIFP